MKVWLLAAALLTLTGQALAADDDGQLRQVDGFGEVRWFGPLSGEAEHPARTVIFISDEHGWTSQTGKLARTVAGPGAVLIGVDLAQYEQAVRARPEACVVPAADFERLEHQLRKGSWAAPASLPILAGHGLGGELAYAVLAQAPASTFAGAVSAAFCPLFSIGKPLCESHALKFLVNGQRRFLQPSKALTAPWRVVQGVHDPLCKAASIQHFAAGLPNAQVTALKDFKHELGDGAEVIPAMAAALEAIASAPAPRAFVARTTPVADAADPVQGGRQDAGEDGGARPRPDAGVSGGAEGSQRVTIEVPAQGGGEVLAVLLTGEAGWSGLDRELSTALAKAGVAVVALDALQSVIVPSSPEGLAPELARVAQKRLDGWKKKQLVLIGEGHGADLLPFVFLHLPPELAAKVNRLVLISPSKTAKLTLDPTSAGEGPSGDVVAELAKLQGPKLLCVQGKEDAESACRGLEPAKATVVQVAGPRHLNGAYQQVVESIVKAVRQP